MSNSNPNPPVSNDHTIVSHPTLQIRADADKHKLAEAAGTLFSEVEYALVVLMCALDSDHGPPAGDIAGSYIHFLLRRLEVLRSHLALLTEKAIAPPPFRKE